MWMKQVFVYYTALSYLPEWFIERRGLANGIVFAGQWTSYPSSTEIFG